MVYSHILQNSMKTNINRDIAVLLHNIRSTHNVGSIFRSSDALGVNVWLVDSVLLPAESVEDTLKL